MKPSRLPLLLTLAASVHAQVFTPKNIDLDVSFTSASPAVTSALNALGGPGLDRIFLTATTDPVPPSGTRQVLLNYTAAGALSAPTTLIVDDTEGGLTYSTAVLAQLKSGQQYFFPPVAGLSTVGAAPAWTISNPVSVLNFQFTDSLGAPVALDGGLILSQDVTVPGSSINNLNLAAGTMSADFLARAGSHPRFTVYADLGGIDPAVSKYRRKYVVDDYAGASALPADSVIPRSVVIDVAGDTSGALSGQFDITSPSVPASASPTVDDDYFEIIAPTPTTTDGWDDYPLLRVVFNAGDGYGNWERRFLFTGANFTSEGSGAFTAANLLPSPPAGQGFYSAFAETFLRRTIAGNPAGVYGLQFFRTPALGSGLNAAPEIPSGTLATGETFVIRPGTLSGTVTLQGPLPVAGQISLLDRVRRATDGDSDGDGIPDTGVSEWFYGTQVWATGVDAIAPGATASASGGQAFIPLPGTSASFNSSTGALTTNYSLALGGLNGQPSYWKANFLSLVLIEHGSTADTYFDTAFNLTDRRADSALRREISAGGNASFDISHSFGEVNLTIRSLAGTIYQPDIRRVVDDPDFPANSVTVDNFAAFGWPVSQAAAASIGSVRTLLPAGTWLITPRVNPGDQPEGSNVDLLPIKVNVPAGGRVNIETGFQLQVAIPRYLTGPTATVSGSVNSGSILVTQIRYSIDGGPDVIVSNPGTASPNFTLNLSAVPDGEHLIRITATGAGGESSSLEATFIRDAAGLTIQQAVILRWGFGVLQRSPDLNTWTDVPAATSPFAEPVTSPRQFWRVRYE